VAKELGYFDIINMYWAYMDANNDGLVTKAEMIAFTESTYQQKALISSIPATTVCTSRVAKSASFTGRWHPHADSRCRA
jgi:hypothetical protein